MKGESKNKARFRNEVKRRRETSKRDRPAEEKVKGGRNREAK
jgi:hypothetical protein